MGGKGRKSSKPFITAKEWAAEWGGAKTAAEENTLFTRLRFDCCSLSFQPMKDPVAACDGTCFERSNILEYIDQHGTHPRTGEPLKISDLFTLKYSLNAEGEPHCPITFKVFTEHSHIVAIRCTGNVFSYDAVNEMNVKFKNFRDLLDDTPFTKKDIVVIQDPHNIHKQNYSEFFHVKNDLQFSFPNEDEIEEGIESKINLSANSATKRIIDQLTAKEAIRQKTSQDIRLRKEQEVAKLFSSYPESDEEGGGTPEATESHISARAQEDTKSEPPQHMNPLPPQAQRKKKPATMTPANAKPSLQGPKMLYTTHPQGQQYASASITDRKSVV